MKIPWTICSVLFLSGCVSVNLPTGNSRKAEGVLFTVPPAPFHDFDSPPADKAWVNDKTGNTISFVSDCGTKMDPPLAQLQSEAASVLADQKTIDEKEMPFDGREAMLSTYAGDVDGIKVKMRILSLKKNSCNYTLTYTGVAKHFDKDSVAFNQFTNSFKAP